MARWAALLLCLGLLGAPALAHAFGPTWVDASSDEDGFEIERAPALNGPFALVGLTAANTTRFIDVGLVAGTLYCYRVRAYSTAGGPGAYSNTACAVFGQSERLQIKVSQL